MKSETDKNAKKDKTKKKGGFFSKLGKKKEKTGGGMSIGTPYGFEQNFHVGFDPTTGQFQVNIRTEEFESFNMLIKRNFSRDYLQNGRLFLKCLESLKKRLPKIQMMF